MTTNLSPTPTAQGIGARAHQRRLRKGAYPVGAKMDALADALAEHDLATGDKGGDLTKAAARIGVSRDYANAMFQQMRKRLGEQAR